MNKGQMKVTTIYLEILSYSVNFIRHVSFFFLYASKLYTMEYNNIQNVILVTDLQRL